MKVASTIPIDCAVPDELQRMLADYVDIANHLISLGLHVRAERDGELRDLARAWFHKHCGGRYQVHYLDSAATFAMANIRSWRERGGDITSLPRVRNPIAFLQNDMFSLDRIGGDLFRLTVKVVPHQPPVTMEVRIKHRHTDEWINGGRLGSLVIIPYGMRLTFTLERQTKPTGNVGMDVNLDSLDLVRDDGNTLSVDLKPIATVQSNHKRKRESVQRTMAHNPAKRDRLLKKQERRERDRVADALHKALHGQDSPVPEFIGDRVLGMEDLATLSAGGKGRRFNAAISKWVRGKAQGILARRHITKTVYARGTSSYCPFCGSKVSHPTWKVSRCPVHGDLDRDLLAAASVLVRSMTRHRKGQPWAVVADVPSITLTPTDVGAGTSPRGRKPDEGKLFAPSVPSADQPQSDTDLDLTVEVVLGNRTDADDNQSLNKLVTTQMIVGG